MSTSCFRDWGAFKPIVSFASGGIQWKNGVGEVTSSIGYSFTQNPSPRLTVFYTQTRPGTEEKRDLNYFIELATVPCRFGGFQYWFICPAVKNGVSCHRRVMKLYLPPGAVYFACRCCYELTYRSCQEHDGRLAKLAKNPLAVYALMNSPNPRDQLKACKAALIAKGIL
ncbi:MAG: hypothetical protein HYZ73_05135 [Elusimicrobia bacterium]|nr:hypothetical protein [Elusimicrobiota bacterium]